MSTASPTALALLDATNDASLLESESTQKVRLIKVYEIVDERNAWWSTRIDRRHPHYYPNRHHLELSVAKRATERLRIQGSQWHIVELPACAFIGTRAALIVTDTYTKSPLTKHAYDASSRPGLAAVVISFAPLRFPRLCFLQPLPITFIDAESTPFLVHQSTNSGSRYTLSWHSSPRAVDIGSLLGILSVCASK